MANIADSYDNMVNNPQNDELGLFSNYNDILEETRRRIISHNCKCILDIGCGTGNLCGKLSDRYNVIGMDKNIEMLKKVQEKYGNMKCKVGSFLDEPFKENIADIVVSTYVLHGLNNEDKKIAVKNMIRYLKENGKIIIIDYMFFDSEEKEKYRQHFKELNKQDLWDFIDSKYYTNINEFKEYIAKLNYNIKIEHKVNFTWLVEITR